MSGKIPVVDCHVHLEDAACVENLERIRQYIGVRRMNIVCIIKPGIVNDNPAALAAKGCFPESFYLFPALDHSAHFSGGRIASPALPEQVDRLMALGADGIKMIETKPTRRKLVDLPVDGPYYAGYFARVEEVGVPLLWHVADPGGFWDPATTPAWARAQGWGYDEGFASREALYGEVENVLRRHPRLRVIFAHFLFLDDDLPRAGRLLDTYEGVCLDLAPHIELLYNLSKAPDAAREFLIRHADRILFGTDITGEQPAEEAAIRSGIITRWLATAEEYRLPAGADFLLGPPEDGVIRGLALPEEVLAQILHANFERVAGSRPKELNRELAACECDRLAAEAGALSGVAPADTVAAWAARSLRCPSGSAAPVFTSSS